MKHSILRKLMLIAVLLTSSHAFAYDFEVDGIYYNIISEASLNAEVTRGDNDYSGKVVIPSNVTNEGIVYNVVSIGESAFDDCDKLTSITIPNSVISIEDYAFDACNGLTSISIPNSVIYIGESVFEACYNLNSIVVESGNTDYDSRNNCNAIIETDSNTLIYGCKNTIIPNSITSIGEAAFSCCYTLTGITIPESVTSIGDWAFADCGLINITIPNSVTSIGNNAFMACGELLKITISNSVKKINESTFGGCSALKSVTIPESVVSIENAAFSGCSSLKSITIPDNVRSIGDYAFSDCENLSSITIGSNVLTIGAEAFYRCNFLSLVYCKPSTPPTIVASSFGSDIPESAILYVPFGSKSAYENDEYWTAFTYIEEKEMSGISSAIADKDMDVSVENGNIVINGVIDNENVGVYNVNGQCVYSGTATTIPVNTKGLYIVKVNGKSFKVML